MRLTCVLGRSGLKEPILEQRVAISELDLEITPVPSATEGTPEMLALRYDIGEMSLAYCVQAISRGMPLVALPIFTARRFFQPCATAARDRGIQGPQDLAGRAVCVPFYWMTSSIWHRGLLTRRYGVADAGIAWHQCGNDPFGLEGLPEAVSVSVHPGTTPLELLEKGIVDALLEPRLRAENERVANLFGDATSAAVADYRESGIIPVVHVIAAQRSTVKRNPGLVSALLELFEMSKENAYAHPPVLDIEPVIPGISHEDGARLLGTDPYPFGLAANHEAIDVFLGLAFEQGLTPRRLALEDAFAMAALTT